MKKKLIIANSLLLLLALTFIVGCKKGEDDPFFSLRSRKARMAGNFEITGYEIVQSDTSGSYKASLVGEELRFELIDSDGKIETGTTPFEARYTFDKKGGYTQSVVTQGDTVEIAGNWYFLKGNEEANLKNKEAIVLNETSYSSKNGDTLFSTTSIGGKQGYPLSILQLKEKEIILYQNYSEVYNQVKYEIKITLGKIKK